MRHLNGKIKAIMSLVSSEKTQKLAKKDVFESPDFYRADEFLTEEHLMIRRAEITDIPRFK